MSKDEDEKQNIESSPDGHEREHTRWPRYSAGWSLPVGRQLPLAPAVYYYLNALSVRPINWWFALRRSFSLPALAAGVLRFVNLRRHKPSASIGLDWIGLLRNSGSPNSPRAVHVFERKVVDVDGVASLGNRLEKLRKVVVFVRTPDMHGAQRVIARKWAHGL